MIFGLANLIAKLFGLDFDKATKWARRVVLIFVAIAVILPVVFIYRACNKPPKLDEKQIQKAQDAIARRDRAEMERILAESDTAESEIDSNLKQIETDREAAKKSYSGYSNDELAEELERRSQQ